MRTRMKMATRTTSRIFHVFVLAVLVMFSLFRFRTGSLFDLRQ
jgi:hypothetical protein